MTTEIEVAELVDPWIYSTLNGDTTLRSLLGSGPIENGLGPLTNDPAFPKINFDYVSGRDVLSADGTIIDTDSIYDVYVIGMGDSYVPISPIAARMHVLLHAVSYTFPGGGSLTCQRERVIKRPDVTQAQAYRYLGGSYRIRCSRD